jgi:hypothetical protein
MTVAYLIESIHIITVVGYLLVGLLVLLPVWYFTRQLKRNSRNIIRSIIAAFTIAPNIITTGHDPSFTSPLLIVLLLQWRVAGYWIVFTLLSILITGVTCFVLMQLADRSNRAEGAEE